MRKITKFSRNVLGLVNQGTILKSSLEVISNISLASCPLGPVTAHGVGILTEMHVIYMGRYTSHRAMPVGPLAAAGEAVTDARKARKYIRIYFRPQT